MSNPVRSLTITPAAGKCSLVLGAVSPKVSRRLTPLILSYLVWKNTFENAKLKVVATVVLLFGGARARYFIDLALLSPRMGIHPG